MIRLIKQFFGFDITPESIPTYLENFEWTDNLDLKLDYLKEIDSQENSRQSSIEAKTSQLIGQTGIIFSLLSIFIANYISKFSTWNSAIQFLLIGLFLTTLFFYLLTIFKATDYLNVSKYRYSQRSIETVKSSYKKENDFKIVEIKDLIFLISHNIVTNNKKCNNLIIAYRFFKTGTFFVGLLSIVLIFSSLILSRGENQNGSTEIIEQKISEPQTLKTHPVIVPAQKEIKPKVKDSTNEILDTMKLVSEHQIKN